MDFPIDLSRVANRAADLLAQKAGVLFVQAVNECLKQIQYFDRTGNNFRETLKLDASNAFVIK